MSPSRPPSYRRKPVSRGAGEPWHGGMTRHGITEEKGAGSLPHPHRRSRFRGNPGQGRGAGPPPSPPFARPPPVVPAKAGTPTSQPPQRPAGAFPSPYGGRSGWGSPPSATCNSRRSLQPHRRSRKSSNPGQGRGAVSLFDARPHPQRITPAKAATQRGEGAKGIPIRNRQRKTAPPPSFRRKPESRGGSATRGNLGHSALTRPQRVIPAKAATQRGTRAGRGTPTPTPITFPTPPTHRRGVSRNARPARAGPSPPPPAASTGPHSPHCRSRESGNPGQGPGAGPSPSPVVRPPPTRHSCEGRNPEGRSRAGECSRPKRQVQAKPLA